MMKVVVIGGTGYIGTAMCEAFARRGHKTIVFSRSSIDYTKFKVLKNELGFISADLVVNCAAYVGKPNVDACDSNLSDLILTNSILPVTIADACDAACVRMIHVSTGCIFQGRNSIGRGFSESDEPNFSFRHGNSSNYSGSKRLAEEALAGRDVAICRIRLPFDCIDHPRNYITKLLTYDKIYDKENSLSHRAEFCDACVYLSEIKANGIWNIVNSGGITASEIVGYINEILKPEKRFKFWESDEEFELAGNTAPRSSCVLDNSKLIGSGFAIRDVRDAIIQSLRAW